MTPEGRVASRPVDEDMGECVEFIDRERSPDNVRYTLAPRPTATSRHRSDVGICSPVRDGKKHRATPEARMEVDDRKKPTDTHKSTCQTPSR